MRYSTRFLFAIIALFAIAALLIRTAIPYSGQAASPESVRFLGLPNDATEISYDFSGVIPGQYTYNIFEFTTTEQSFKNWVLRFDDLKLQIDASKIWRYDNQSEKRIDVTNGYIYANESGFPHERHVSKRIAFDKSTKRAYYYYYEQSAIEWFLD